MKEVDKKDAPNVSGGGPLDPTVTDPPGYPGVDYPQYPVDYTSPGEGDVPSPGYRG